MTDATALAALGMINDIRQMDIISQNIANANTNGYKRDLPVSGMFADRFESMLADATLRSASLRNDMPIPGIGSVIDRSPGALKFTGNPLDVAIEGDGFFEVSTDEGVRYTRLGAFRLDVAGRLVTMGGHVVNGVGGEIRLMNLTPKIDRQGRLFDGEDMIGQLKIVQFGDMDALHRTGGGLYRAETAGESAAMNAERGVRQGHLEASNVNVMDEMVRMITTTRHFESLQRVVSGYDQMIGEAVSTLAEF